MYQVCKYETILFASMGHALSDQHFASYENVRKWLSVTGLPQKSDGLFGVASTNCQTGGENV